MSRKTKRVAERIEDIAGEQTAALKELGGTALDHIVERPYTILIAAVAVGFLAGVMLNRR